VAAIATVSGTAIRPGISRNNRKYSVDAIGRMVERANQRLTDGDMPLTTLTHHEAGDDSTRIVGRITRIAQEADGSASYEAEITDTGHGRDILSLVSGNAPALKGVSIRGAWVGPVRRESGPGGVTVETADDLELDGLDYTRKPGVLGAGIASVALAGAEPRESDGTARVPITESAPEASVTITEAAATDAGPFADPNYHGEPRFPVGTRTEAKTAWLALTESATAREYTAAQLKRVKQRVGKALKGHGVTVESAGSDSWLIDPPAPLAECFGYSDDPGHGGDLAVTMSNGPVTVTISSWCIDPHDLMAVGRAAMTGACGALATIDPDMDADIDVPGAPAEDTDDDATESAPEPVAAPVEPTPSPQTSAPEPPAADTTSPEEEPAMAEPNTAAVTAAAPAAGGVHFTDDQFAKFLDRLAPAAAAPVEAAPAAVEPVVEAAPVVEAPAAVTETEDQRIAHLIAEGVKAALPAAIQEHVEQNGPPGRKGLVTQVTEHTATVVPGLPEGAPAKQLHEYTDEEWRQYMAPVTVANVLGTRNDAPTA
jgi:hypothetical protein